MHNAMMGNRQHMDQMMGPMMNAIMGDSQMRDTDPTIQQNIQDHLLEHYELMQTLAG